MDITEQQFEYWLTKREKENLEFKEAKIQFDYKKMMKYCCAIANEGGGNLIFGVTDKLPRQVVGSNAFQNYNQIKKDLFDTFRLRFEIEEFFYGGKRTLIFSIPSRSTGLPLYYENIPWMRVDESLISMTPDHLKKIFNESQPDFSAQVCENAVIDDLDEIAIHNLRHLWSKKSGNAAMLTIPIMELLQGAELLIDVKLNYGALILLGKKEALGRLLPNAEIIYEYRSSESSISAQQRQDYRIGFLAIYQKLWDLINLRNDIEHVREGLFIRDIPNFNEEVIREALLNAVTHRDYHLQGSVFIRQFPKLLEIENPGGFPTGVTPENILYKQNPRNRRIAEVFQKCGLIERSGQGADKMFRFSIEEAKSLPDYTRSDTYSVNLRLSGGIQDVQFLKFLEKISEEKKIDWTVSDLVLLEYIHQGIKLTPSFHDALYRLINQDIIEVSGRGKGVKYILSKKFYTFLGEKGVYTRRKGLDTGAKKALLIKHIEHYSKAKFDEFNDVIPGLTRDQLKNLLKSLRKEGKIEFLGAHRNGYWVLK
ncbi:MAG: transcriptional regulator [Ignavibacteria bacterium CG_4_10_14_3_um_filter_37_18]|nr:transcriptional regulator [Ignavibacteria bacterium]PIX93212.1 MAG: transcriptional regulator [Ignavibacteria bacterium CG_4_10_14_3_um_filter_37_18]PJC59856.1 MAG: transcriptional regulator [Ignavibacteria bacterium CG_4_9_14_0_2_um_filter_37_13]